MHLGGEACCQKEKEEGWDCLKKQKKINHLYDNLTERSCTRNETYLRTSKSTHSDKTDGTVQMGAWCPQTSSKFNVRA